MQGLPGPGRLQAVLGIELADLEGYSVTFPR